MARNFAVNFDSFSIATPPKTAVELVGGTTVQEEIYEILIGSRSTPASQAATYQVLRHTATGTGTAATPQPLNPDFVAAVSTAKVSDTVEPTYTATAIIWELPLNQQSSYRWVVQPGFSLGLFSSRTALNGLGLKCIGVTASPFSIDGHVHFAE